MWSEAILQLFERGGPVMWPLLGGSILGLAIILERSVYFVRRRLRTRAFAGTLFGLVRRGDLAGAVRFASGFNSPVARIAACYLRNLECSDALRQDILKREGSRCMEDVESHLRGLSLIAHLAPLLGLLGTVTGLVSAFHVIEKLEGMAQPAQLAAGIWESLLTTVCGLVIAIPCLAAFHGFEQQADRIARRMQFMISELNELFGKREDLQPIGAAQADDEDLRVVAS